MPAAKASPKPEHPAYLHALADLRDARAQLQRPDGGELREQEKKAVHEIDDAINEIKKAAIDDGRDLNDHAPVDTMLEDSLFFRSIDAAVGSSRGVPIFVLRKKSPRPTRIRGLGSRY